MSGNNGVWVSQRLCVNNLLISCEENPLKGHFTPLFPFQALRKTLTMLTSYFYPFISIPGMKIGL